MPNNSFRFNIHAGNKMIFKAVNVLHQSVKQDVSVQIFNQLSNFNFKLTIRASLMDWGSTCRLISLHCLVQYFLTSLNPTTYPPSKAFGQCTSGFMVENTRSMSLLLNPVYAFCISGQYGNSMGDNNAKSVPCK